MQCTVQDKKGSRVGWGPNETLEAKGSVRRGLGLGALLLLVFALLAAAYALAVPPGEAPDEPAHLFYIDTIVRAHALPAGPPVFDGDNYEFFQPPLDYAVSALWAGLVHGSPLGLRFTPNPAFSFRQRGSRMFLPGAVPAASAAARALLELRLTRLAWGLAMAWFIYLTALYFAAGDAVRAALAAAPLIFAPQAVRRRHREWRHRARHPGGGLHLLSRPLRR